MTPHRMLVVDDEDPVRENVVWFFNREGFEVKSARSEDEAKRLVESGAFDVVLLDMKMDRNESGIELLRLIKTLAPSTEVIILTAYGNLSNAATAMELGAFSYVEKNIPDVDVYHVLLLKVKQALHRKRLEEENRQLQLRLAESERRATLGILASVIAHEVNNPLTGILGFTQFARESVAAMSLDEGPFAAEKRQLHDDLKLIEENTMQCQRILRSILEVARPSAVPPLPVQIGEALEKVVTLMEKEAHRRGVCIQRNYDQQDALVMAAPNQVAQIFMNLIVNAVQAMPEGGTLAIRTDVVNSNVLVRVSDTGHGIAAEHLPHIFDPFFSTRDPENSTGLGLYICKDLVHKLNGDIHAESTPGSGTTFTVKLPRIE